MDDALMESPVLLQAFRGDLLEIQHRGVFAVAAAGRVVKTRGDARAPIFVRSGAKPFQTLFALEQGIADAHALDDRHLAVMTASHIGDSEHLDAVRELLGRGGLAVADLGCGIHPPISKRTRAELRAKSERPSALHNNCSGKHAGMLLAAARLGIDRKDYLNPENPLQKGIRARLAEEGGVSIEDVKVCVDGCSAPTFALSAEAMAIALSRLAQAALGAKNLPAARLTRALRNAPDLLGGRERFDSRLIKATSGRWLAKVGADGFHGAFCPALALGIAVHLDDGSNPAAERVLLALIDALDLEFYAARSALLEEWSPLRKNHAGRIVGHYEAHAP